MAYQKIDGVYVWGEPDQGTIAQAAMCAQTGNVVKSLLMADHHLGYSQPIGGVVVYDGQISPSGVGYDIACGNKAVRTPLYAKDIRKDLSKVMDRIASEISFGIGRKNKEKVDHDLCDDPDCAVYQEFGHKVHDDLKKLARDQLGTVGRGNHYIDLFEEEETGKLWIANHFGSRGFGHRTATGFMNIAAGRRFFDRAPHTSMNEPPTLLDMDQEQGELYYRAMQLAGRFAYAGRDYVMDRVLSILGTTADFEVHNHHNYAWKEVHHGQEVIVVRKGATPSHPGQMSFVGGSMGDISVVIRGKDNEFAKKALYSTIHGAGRVMSRTRAAGRWRRVRGRRVRVGGEISMDDVHKQLQRLGVELRGGGPDEAPGVYRNLQDVLDAHASTIDVLHVLKPIGVAMAPMDEHDPYKD